MHPVVTKGTGTVACSQWRLSYKKDGRCSSENLKRSPKRHQDSALKVWLNFLSLVNIISCYIFSAQYHNWHHKSSRSWTFRGWSYTLRGTCTKTVFLTPKACQEQPGPFYMECSLRGRQVHHKDLLVFFLLAGRIVPSSCVPTAEKEMVKDTGLIYTRNLTWF